MPGAYSAPIPNYSRLGQINLAEEVRRNAAMADRRTEMTRAQLAQLHAKTEGRSRLAEQVRAAKESEALAGKNLKLRQDQESRLATAAGIDQDRRTTADTQAMAKLIESNSVDIYADSGTSPEAFKSAVASMVDRHAQVGTISPKVAQTFTSAIDDPQGFKDFMSEIGGKYKSKQLKNKGYRSNTIKSPETWMHPKTGEVVKWASSGGITGPIVDGRVVPGDPSMLEGFELQADIGAGNKQARKEQAKSTQSSYDMYQEAGDQARVFVNAADIMRSTIADLDASDFGYTSTPKRVLQKIGESMNAIAGTVVVDVDSESLATKTLLDAIKPDQALTFTAKTKGAISDAEMRLFLSAVPDLLTSRDGYILVANMLDRLGQRAIDSADYVADLTANSPTGLPPAGLKAMVRNHFKDDPLFSPEVMKRLRNPSASPATGTSEESATASGTSPPAVGTVSGGYEFLGGDPADPASWRQQL